MWIIIIAIVVVIAVNEEYKQFMPQLYVAVKDAFPNVEFEFDDSRVLTKHLYFLPN